MPYTGLKENITVAEKKVPTIDVMMYDAAPVLSINKTGDTSYVVSWTKVPLADSYLLEENNSSEFISEVLYDDSKFSSTVYSGADTTKTFTGKESGTFYYAVFAVTRYGDSYTPSQAGNDNWNFNISVKYGAMSNIALVQSGATGTMKIDIPWPSK